MEDLKKKYDLPLIDAQLFNLDPDRYELRSGVDDAAPSCPFGNKYQWIGYDRTLNLYVRFTKSVFKRLISDVNNDTR